MDPATELATLATSYLWALRDLFPTAARVGDLPIREIAKTLVLRRPRERLGGGAMTMDFALVTRLFDIADRADDERWPLPPRAPLAGMPIGKAAVEFCSRLSTPALPAGPDHEARRLQANRAGERGLSRWRPQFGAKLTEDDYVSIARAQLSVFLRHARFLQGRFEHLAVRGSVDGQLVTRDTFTRAIHDDLRSPGTLLPLARKLDYVPVLLRAFHKVNLLGTSNDFAAIAEAVLQDQRYPHVLIERCREENVALPFPLVLLKRAARRRTAAWSDFA